MENSAVITVLGKDRKGIIAAVSRTLADEGVNILDISQTILQELFSMVMIVDYSDICCPLTELQDMLDKVASGLGVEVRMQRREIFDAMHKV